MRECFTPADFGTVTPAPMRCSGSSRFVRPVGWLVRRRQRVS